VRTAKGSHPAAQAFLPAVQVRIGTYQQFVDRDRQRARWFLASAPTLVAGIRASSGFEGLSWPCLRVLHILSIRDGRTVEHLAVLLGLDSVSAAAEALRAGGYLVESRCNVLPAECPSPLPSGRPCGKHHIQQLTDKGREVAAAWEEPYLAMLLGTEPSKWIGLGQKLRNAHRRRKVK
jgi:hypothetical protein